MNVDFGKTASDYAKHRVGFSDRFFDRLFEDGIIAKGNRVLDLGTRDFPAEPLQVPHRVFAIFGRNP